MQELPPRRTHAPRRRTASQSDISKGQMLRLLVCLAILFVTFCLKLAFPVQTREVLQRYVIPGAGIEAGIEAIGSGLRDVFGPVKPPAGDIPEVSVTPTPELTPEPTPTEQADTIPEAEQEAGTTQLSVPVFDYALKLDELLMEAAARPVIATAAGELIVDPEEDNTPNVPFGMEVPDKADFSLHELPFEFAAPLSGKFTSGFGYRMHPIDNIVKFHYGQDIAASKGTKVKAFAAGTVTVVGYNGSYGNYIMIEHAGGYVTLYAHLNTVNVKKGAKVKLGATVGRVGETGKATGPHLHFEIRYQSKLLDPMPYLTYS